MRKFCLVLIMVMLFFPSYSVMANQKSVSLAIDGVPVYCSSPPVITEGRTFVPSSVLVSVLDVGVRWNSSKQSITLVCEDTTVEMSIGSREAKVNGKSMEMEAAPMVVGKSKMIPLRFFATSLGFTVAWEDETKTVQLSKKKPVTSKPEAEQSTPAPPKEENTAQTPENKEPVVLPTMEHSVIQGVTAGKGDMENCIYVEISKPVTPKISVLEDPTRIVFDFEKTILKSSGKIKDVPLLEEVRYSNWENNTARVVLEAEEERLYTAYYENGKYCICVRDGGAKVNFSDGILQFPEGTEIELLSNKASGATFEVSPAVKEQTIPVNACGISGISVKNNGSVSKVSVLYTAPQNAVVADASICFEYATFAEIRKEYQINNDVHIVLDAGHGGTDPGAIGYLSDGGIGVKESVANLYITLRVAELLEDCGIQISLTRSDDIFVGLYERADFANDLDADLFVSFHNNASDADKTVQGTMVMYMTSSVRGAKLAKTVLSAVIEETGQTNLGMRSGDKLVVIRTTAMPAILVEGGFLTTPEERERLKDTAFLDSLAAGIAKGILEYVTSDLD